MFNPDTKYDVVQKDFPLEDFHRYSDEFVERPPYQRKTVWSRKKQQTLLDSLFRRYYVPRIVIRQVRLDEDRTVNEIIDGQQRITTAKRFFRGELKLPGSLEDVHPELPGAAYSELSPDLRRFIDRELTYSADVVKGIDDPENPEHQEIATEIFWRLQQGETLNYMEVAHSRLASTARNFVVRYADDQRFDFDAYRPKDENPEKHEFFELVDRKNNRMQHLALLTRFLMFEAEDGPTDIKPTDVQKFIDNYKTEDGIGDWGSFAERRIARETLGVMDELVEIFSDDPMLDEENGLKEFKTEYFIISTYLLLRHLREHYVFDEEERTLFREFVVDFHQRWKQKPEDDTDILIFSDNRQQSANEIAARQRIFRQAFFAFAREYGHEMLSKDDRRSFSEAERIQIYRRADGLCEECLAEGKSEKEARVSWAQWEADHVVPHSRGGATSIDNAQLLCRYHNRTKGAESPAEVEV